jgi:hypothetical protein
MTVSMPRFGAKFQLNGSGIAICSLLKSCGAAGAQSGCATLAPAVSTPAGPRPPLRNANCTAGQVFRPKAGRCVCLRSAPFFYGGRCRVARDCPGDSVLNARGQCIKENEPPPRLTSPTGGHMSRRQRSQCARCLRHGERAAAGTESQEPADHTPVQHLESRLPVRQRVSLHENGELLRPGMMSFDRFGWHERSAQ